jgi:hypothetical protein
VGGGEDVDTGLGDRLGDEDAGHVPSLAARPGC